MNWALRTANTSTKQLNKADEKIEKLLQQISSIRSTVEKRIDAIAKLRNERSSTTKSLKALGTLEAKWKKALQQLSKTMAKASGDVHVNESVLTDPFHGFCWQDPPPSAPTQSAPGLPNPEHRLGRNGNRAPAPPLHQTFGTAQATISQQSTLPWLGTPGPIYSTPGFETSIPFNDYIPFSPPPQAPSISYSMTTQYCGLIPPQEQLQLPPHSQHAGDQQSPYSIGPEMEPIPRNQAAAYMTGHSTLGMPSHQRSHSLDPWRSAQPREMYGQNTGIYSSPGVLTASYHPGQHRPETTEGQRGHQMTPNSGYSQTSSQSDSFGASTDQLYHLPVATMSAPNLGYRPGTNSEQSYRYHPYASARSEAFLPASNNAGRNNVGEWQEGW